MTEFELKLEILPDRLQPVAAAMREGKTGRQRLQARYFDTEEGTLARHGIVLRVRKEGRKWLQTAKGPASGPVERLEHNVALAAAAAGAAPAPDLSRHAGTPVGDKIERALKLKGGAIPPPLVPLYETDVQRLTRSVELGVSTVEIAFDQGRVVAGGRSFPLCELELELKQGMPEDAVALARDWCAEHGLWLSSITKSMKGQRLAAHQRFGPAVSARAPVFSRRAGGHQITMTVLQACLEQVVGNASEVAAGSSDADPIHQLRVGIRRLRTALREFKALAEGIAPAWEAPLVDVFRELGRHRDHSHLARRQQPQIEAAGGPVLDANRASDAVPEAQAVVRSAAFQDALLCLIGFAHSADWGVGSPDPKSAMKIFCTRLQKLHAQTLKDGRKFMALEETRQHDVRKRLKRLRYLTEFVAPLFSRRRTEAFISSLKPVQEALGLYNDELMALQAYRSLAAQDPQAWFGVGWLAARRAPNAKACFDALQVFAKVRPYWD